MRIIADLHIHSPYSRATSPKLTPPYLERWAAVKGLDLVGTGDCTHPVWLKELRDQLDDAEEGLYTLNPAVRDAFNAGPAQSEGFSSGGAPERVPRFVLTGEISTIYKKNDKTRKVHHLVILPDFKSAAAFQTKLERIGTISADGRPILGADSRDLLAMLLDTDERSVLIPAHIWTPWFSALGAKSGFDSIDECYGDCAPYITAVETGLSSNPPMNWALASLDRFVIISNSDAHSPEKLGREATVFELEEGLSLPALREALRLEGGRGSVAETIEFFPQEGKYHYDGHRKCGVCLTPEETLETKGICPVCRKPLTQGVMSRVLELADRPVDETAPYVSAEKNRRPYYSLIPLKELLGELLETGSASKKVDAAYTALTERVSELSILRDAPIQDLERLRCPGVSGELLAQGIARMREGTVSITPGYDGEYGIIRAFPSKPELRKSPQLWEAPPEKTEKKQSGRTRKKRETQPKSLEKKEKSFIPDLEQERAVHYEGACALIIAGPGAGKTAVLAARIAHLIRRGTDAKTILAVSFTVKAAVALRERIIQTAGDEALGVTAATFHGLCASILREEHEQLGLPGDFTIASEEQRDERIKRIQEESGNRRSGLGSYIETRKRFLLAPGETNPAEAVPAEYADSALSAGIPDAEKERLYARYQAELRSAGSLDFDDLITETARLFARNPETLKRYRERFHAIFVDEYQDVNFAQYLLIRLLAFSGQDKRMLWVIGDPNQAIYGFRGADKRFIDRFLTDYPAAETFRLTRSFRCGEGIVSAAGLLMNARLKGTADEVRLFRTEYPSESAEADGIARRIARLIGGTSFLAFDSGLVAGDDSEPELTGLRECAILLRTMTLAQPVTAALGMYGIPCLVSGEKPWWETDPIAPLLKALRESLQNEKRTKPVEAVETLWNRIPRPKREGAVRESLDRLLGIASLYGDLGELLDTLSVGSVSDGLELDREGVRIMTIHASKGLEFEHVFVPALEEGLLPFTIYGGLSEDQLEEEKRLLYVAMTRAKKGLYLSYAKKRVFQGRNLEHGRSRFLDALEQAVPDYQEKRRRKPADPQMNLF